jgi:anaerobic dimethyl sulfoxide reductase subunit B (iron-sulfur subunit)
MTQYGFFFDQSRCDSCGTCAVACKDWNDLPPGSVKYLRVYEWEKGAWPTTRLHTFLGRCFHCENPVCVDACPSKAIYKEGKYGAVLIDSTKCTGTRQCFVACPYGAPTFASDAPGEKANMCHMCVDRLEAGNKPICVMSCPMRALDFDTLEHLQAKYGNVRDLEDVPSSATTSPAAIYKKHLDHKVLVPYDANKALAINATRPVGPAIYTMPTDVTLIPDGLLSRGKLVLKAKNQADFMKQTRTING